MKKSWFQLGNVYIDPESSFYGSIDYDWTHALIPDEIYMGMKSSCKLSSTKFSDKCIEYIKQYSNATGNINYSDIYAPLCNSTPGSDPVSVLFFSPDYLNVHIVTTHCSNLCNPCLKWFTVLWSLLHHWSSRLHGQSWSSDCYSCTWCKSCSLSLAGLQVIILVIPCILYCQISCPTVGARFSNCTNIYSLLTAYCLLICVWK